VCVTTVQLLLLLCCPGNYQLELSDYTIRIRELSDSLNDKTVELEAKRSEFENATQSSEAEIETVRAGWNNEVQGLKDFLKKAEKK